MSSRKEEVRIAQTRTPSKRAKYTSGENGKFLSEVFK
jgi:DNA-binding XRE family transcriptional regulator